MHTFSSPLGLSRLSDYLRLNTNVSRPRDPEDEMSDEAYLRSQRVKVLKQMQRNYLCTWNQLRSSLLESCKLKNLSEKEVSDRLKDFCFTVRQFTGDEWPGDLIETSAIFVLQLFYDSLSQDGLGPTANDQKHKLRCMFGTNFITDHLLNRTYEQCRQILKLLDETDVQYLFNKAVPYGNQRKNQNQRRNKMFEYLKEKEWQPEDSLEVDLFQHYPDKKFIDFQWDANGVGTNEKTKLDFSLQYKQPADNRNAEKTSNDTERADCSDPSKDHKWLIGQLQRFIAENPDFGLSLSCLESLFLQPLEYNTDISLLAMELESLLGAERYASMHETIATAWRNKENILESYRRSKQLSLIEPVAKIKQPSITQSVLIQSAEEKTLQKSYNKFEKKAMKEFRKKNKEDGDRILAVETERKRRQQELMTEMHAPLLKEAPINTKSYPFVFDSYAEAKQSAAYICGHRMILPSGFERKDDKRWEEITIPPASKPPPYIADKFKLVKIEELNQLGQKVFAGVKSLNQVQSVVYHTACNANNNMLICAPTGAGKTNVALLAILNEICKHYDPSTGLVKKENFKIVYIAPMKALASEMTDNFSKRLQPLQISVRELTGDMQLTKTEIMNTQMLVTTPEKWDVVTRKSKGDVQLMLLVKLLIIDEVHLLQSDRGTVLEGLVARTIRHVESTQQMIRIVGLSATLPNYVDVAEFLRVNLKEGLFFFDNRFRPVPLEQTFITVKAAQHSQQMHDMDEVCYEKVYHFVNKGYQCMVFVHSRNSTYKTAIFLRDQAKNEQHGALFQSAFSTSGLKSMERSKNKMLQELLPTGFAIHHAGMLRYDRNLVEKLFREGAIKVLVCTSTLAWGVNLPAHAVVIKGTEIYDSAHGSLVDLSMLDVMQIFGRAGRPQYDTEGHGTIITAHAKLQHYLSLLTNQFPIESKFQECLTDNLNAEIALGTITTVEEAIEWLSYTYLYVRMMRRPIVYGIPYKNLENDPLLLEERRRLIMESARLLDDAKMIRFDPKIGTLDPTDLGRTASHYYIKYDTIQKFNELLRENMMEDDIIAMLCVAQEFGQLKSREEEMSELLDLHESACFLKVKNGIDSAEGKVNVLLQSALSRYNIESFSLVSDSMFVQQNVVRISRGLFEYVLKRGMASMAHKLLLLCKMLERGMWNHETPFRQFYKNLSVTDFEKLERLKLSPDKIRSEEYSAKEIGRLIRTESKGAVLKRLAYALPRLHMTAKIQPITRTVLRVTLDVVADFHWEDIHHGKVCESFWIWMADTESNHIYHYEHFKVTKKQVVKKEVQTLVFTIPLLSADKLPSHYLIHCDSEYWLGCVQDEAVPCKDIILPEKYLPFTKLLDLDPLPVTALNNSLYSSLYSFTHFNPIQTQIFHTLYHTDANVLLGAPTGSGKTNCAEIAIFRVFQRYPDKKVVYIAPLKALVRERVDDWKKRLGHALGRKVVELTGDVTPDVKSMAESDIIVTTPEKWDGISRSWQTRRYVRDVALIVIDEIHLLGEDRGPVLEVIVSRTNFIMNHTGSVLRIIGLSTAIANAQDLANWLRIGKIGLYNFKPSVRPVPLEVHVSGYPGKHYCPRMALMNKPTFRAIKQHSPDKPVIIFVSSRRQTRLTAFDIIAYVAQDNPKQWLHMTDEEMEYLIKNNIRDANLRMTLAFGVGLHHAGLQEKDRTLVEELFLHNKIQILVTTATLAWGINLPAHLVIVKGTEYYDGKQHRYVDFPITDVLQMMGRAGRPQFDTFGKAVILVHDIKKEYYKKFLYEPFPVESSLMGVLPEHLNAEIVAGTVKTKDDCMDYLTWTYLFRRLLKNPSYYELENVEEKTINRFLTNLVDKSVAELVDCKCVDLDETDQRSVVPTSLGRIASFYYLHHTTVKLLSGTLDTDTLDFKNLLQLLAKCHEFDELPVRHNEDQLNAELSEKCRYPVLDYSFDSSNTKAFLLFQAHFSRLELPCSDYLTDLKSVLDQSIRVIQAMIDIAAMRGFLSTTLKLVSFLQMVTQARWFDDSSLLTLPHVDLYLLKVFESKLSETLPELVHLVDVKGYELLLDGVVGSIEESKIGSIYETLVKLPFIDVSCSIRDVHSESGPNSDVNFILQSPLTPVQKRKYIKLFTDTEYVLNVSCRKKPRQHFGRHAANERTSRAIAPLFPKKKDEGWIVVLGEMNSSELLALKRAGYIAYHRSINSLVFRTPSSPGRVIYTLYLMSDAYIGLDQQYDLCVELEAKC